MLHPKSQLLESELDWLGIRDVVSDADWSCENRKRHELRGIICCEHFEMEVGGCERRVGDFCEAETGTTESFE